MTTEFKIIWGNREDIIKEMQELFNAKDNPPFPHNWGVVGFSMVGSSMYSVLLQRDLP